jgi:hypothetical protein
VQTGGQGVWAVEVGEQELREEFGDLQREFLLVLDLLQWY